MKNLLQRLMPAFLLFCTCVTVRAQMMIRLEGSAPVTYPQAHTVLELTNTDEHKGGLRLPQLDTNHRDALGIELLTGEAKEKAKGLMIFNTTTKCVEYWNGSLWKSFCQSHQ